MLFLLFRYAYLSPKMTANDRKEYLSMFLPKAMAAELGLHDYVAVEVVKLQTYLPRGITPGKKNTIRLGEKRTKKRVFWTADATDAGR